MTVLDFDPPQSPLRLVHSNNTTDGACRDHRYRDSMPLFGDARDLFQSMLQASLRHQYGIDPDALRVVLAAKQATTGCPATAFSAAGIWQLMFVDVVTWCRNRQLDVPAGCTTALIRVIEHLDHSGLLNELSDPAADLYDAIDECTGGWCDDPHPSTPTKPRRSLRSSRGTKRT